MNPFLRPAMAWPLLGIFLVAAGMTLWLCLPAMDGHWLTIFRLDPSSSLIPATTLLTNAGGFSTLGPVAMATVFVLALKGRKAEALWLFLSIGSGRLFVEAAKGILARPRPPLVGRLDEVTSLSFPSSHAAGSMLTMLALALLFGRDRPWLTPMLAAFALGVGWSRLALGVHWPSDVLAGWGLALIWIGIASRWLPIAPRRAI
ncbi:phosphatase PAP2 family protein [Rhizorhabdus sp. FW153]|uniref:phosphatase PAP2 family protein n=1 Tax=Rhizorhabdus sp. FW153 TaxID=3400216 RepID=UPI003CEB9E23